MEHLLVKRFGQADLELEIARLPINPSNRQIFQLDIRQEGRSEHFRAWPGDARIEAQVMSVDRALRQLTLYVREPRRRFEERVAKNGFQFLRLKIGLRLLGGRIVGSTPDAWIVERWTEGKARYLCGRDERNLFIAPFAHGTSVRDAHASLRPRVVPAGAQRQGEWFFVPLPALEERRLEAELRARPWLILRKESIGPGGQPHVADELVRLRDARSASTYVRGRVRHPDHVTRELRTWHRVIRNAEMQSGWRALMGATWVE
jgi:hypothetical protein